MESIVRDRRRNLGQIYLATGRPLEALAEFQALAEDDPEEKGGRIAIANCLLSLGRLDECEKLIDEVLDSGDSAPLAAQYRGMICFRRGRMEEALRYLKQAEEQAGPNPQIYAQIGFVYLRRQRWEEAEQALTKALEIDPDHAPAYDGLGVAYRQQGKLQEAALAHLRSIALLHHQASAHQNLGIVLMQLGRIPWAVRAFQTSLQINPDNPLPHNALAEIYEKAVKRPRLAEHHRTMAAKLARAQPGADTKQ